MNILFVNTFRFSLYIKFLLLSVCVLSFFVCELLLLYECLFNTIHDVFLNVLNHCTMFVHELVYCAILLFIWNGKLEHNEFKLIDEYSKVDAEDENVL